MPRETTRIRVAFGDVDGSQRIHFTAMFRYFEVAEHALMRALGLPYATTLREHKFPRAHLECDFRGPVGYDDQIDVEARVERVGATSWTIGFTARRTPVEAPADDMSADDAPAHSADATGAVVADGKMVIVALDAATERPIPLPAALRAALEQGRN
jgi:YbgC/YbaW family acyl-CoA thioester hydrolase